jgi:hypothetical protein
MHLVRNGATTLLHDSLSFLTAVSRAKAYESTAPPPIRQSNTTITGTSQGAIIIENISMYADTFKYIRIM